MVREIQLSVKGHLWRVIRITRELRSRLAEERDTSQGTCCALLPDGPNFSYLGQKQEVECVRETLCS